jgi:hypothetical protein
MQHAECISLFEALKSGDKGTQAQSAQKHLGQCGPCQRLWERYDAQAQAPDLVPGVMAAITPHAFTLRWPLWLAPVAAVLALAILVSAFWRPERQWLNEDRGYAWEERSSSEMRGTTGRLGRGL